MERFWYTVGLIALGAAYFAKLPAAKALDEVDGTHLIDGWAAFWYYLFNVLPPGGMYLAKVPVKRALEQRDHQKQAAAQA